MKDSVEFRYVPLHITDQIVFSCFFNKGSTLLYSMFYICRKYEIFHIQHNRKTSCLYLDIAAFKDLKVQLLLPRACEDFARVFAKERRKNNCKFEFRLNCKQRLKFHQGPISNNKFMSLDAAQFCFCEKPTNCLASMNKSARRCVFFTVSKT